MKRVTFASTYAPEAAHPIHREVMADGGPTQAALLVWMPVATARTLTWFDASREPVAGLIERVDAVEDYSLADGEDGTYAVVDQPTFELDAAALEALVDERVLALPPITFHADGLVRFDVVGQSGALGEFYRSMDAVVDTEIERVADYRGHAAPVDATTRQLAALRVGLEVGYYAVPRTGSVADVAGELGCARSTAGELLRKGEVAALEGVFGSR